MAANSIDRISIIDGNDLNRKNRTGIYVLNESKKTLIETSSSPSVPFILDGLCSLGIDPLEIEYIILTHIHLDHAGGAGLLLKHCKNAKVIVHKKGARHLENPSRLIAGARAVYGDDFDRLFDPILPIPPEKIIIKENGETLQISDTTTLTFFDTPGHANHHLSIYDPISNGMFTGDTIGIYYRELKDDGFELYIPSTSPNQFDPDKMLSALSIMEEKHLDAIYFGHYGCSRNTSEIYKQIRYWIPIFTNYAKDAFNQGESFEDRVELAYTTILSDITGYLADLGITEAHPVFEVLKLDIRVSSMGLIDYFAKQEQKVL
ncbi:MBL fold metallo-hydrolase [Peribacillus saganii]|uniref:MBL fold metallo-hydrolase n=1 Tax=Peribacillus saganii TaxID=2303992 RepID=A0A372LSB2_9BACI|nr:MBL fold metallo-hydrolase [Peribacillus saganii]RFU71091.1 MBL fold metallo-hydrolase [Peribacillus saganii]